MAQSFEQIMSIFYRLTDPNFTKPGLHVVFSYPHRLSPRKTGKLSLQPTEISSKQVLRKIMA
jgi:hypothetical protein